MNDAQLPTGDITAMATELAADGRPVPGRDADIRRAYAGLLHARRLYVTLPGRPGTGILVVTSAPQACALIPGLPRAEVTYGVGTTGDPFLTDAEYVLRAHIEDAANPFRRFNRTR